MQIEKIIKEMVDNDRTRIDQRIEVDAKPYKVTAYKIPNQGLIRIDIRQLEGPRESGIASEKKKL